MIHSLKIENFRVLEYFHVAKLGRVNLIVGKNNSGKSTVLEALRIYAGNANRELLENIAKGHDEKHFLDNGELDSFNNALPFEDLFTGRKFPEDNRSIAIGELDNTAKQLEIKPVYSIEKKQVVVNGETGDERIEIRRSFVDKNVLLDGSELVGEALLVSKGNQTFPIYFDFRGRDFIIFYEKIIPCSVIPTQFIAINELAKAWDAIALTEGEDIVKEALRIILPEVVDLTFVDDNIRFNQEPRRLAKVKLSGMPRPVSLASLGDGMLRILQLVLKIFSAKGGFLLIDEFENGLHYTVQEKIWQLLFKLSAQLDVQVFATTHSWDCIESFANVAVGHQDIEGILFRVGQSVRTSDKGQVIATVFDREQLYSITQSDVEVR